jgi:hypothetical protein
MSEGNALLLYNTTRLLQLISKHTRRLMPTHKTPFTMYELYSGESESDSVSENESSLRKYSLIGASLLFNKSNLIPVTT